MLLRLILLLTLVPLLELVLLVQLTRLWHSLALTIGIVLATGVIGALLARHEGSRVLRGIRSSFERGEIPADGLLDGLLILVAAAFLVTPGLITDTVGFMLLIPFTRVPVRSTIKAWARRRIAAGNLRFWQDGGFGPIRDEPPPGAPPIEDEGPPS
jgi:UPF0716 protein FxsA